MGFSQQLWEKLSYRITSEHTMSFPAEFLKHLNMEQKQFSLAPKEL